MHNKQQIAQLEAQMMQMKLAVEQQKQAMDMQGARMKAQQDMLQTVMQNKLDVEKQLHDITLAKIQSEVAVAGDMHKSALALNHQRLLNREKIKAQRANGGGASKSK